MKNTKRISLLAIWIIFPLFFVVAFQTMIDYNTQVRNKPITYGTSTPSSCTLTSNIFYNTTNNTSYICDGAHYVVQTPFIGTTPLNFLRVQPNILPLQGEYAPPVQIEVQDFDFAPISPSVALSAGVPATITLTPGPLGVMGGNTAHQYLHIGTVGTVEDVLLTGAGCPGDGITACTIHFTPVNSHAVGYTLKSSTAGGEEAILYGQSGYKGAVHFKTGQYNIYKPIYVDLAANLGLKIYGDTYEYFNLVSGTVVTNLNTAGLAAFQIVGSASTTGCESETLLASMTIHGSTTSGSGIEASNACNLRLDRVFQVESNTYGFICQPNCYTVKASNSFFYSNGLEGAYMGNAANSVFFDTVGFQANCRQAPGITCNDLTVTSSGTNALAVAVTNSGFALGGIQSIGAIPSSSSGAGFYNVKALLFQGNYCEQNMTHCVFVDGTSRGVTINANYMQQSGIQINSGTIGINIHGNHFVSGNPVQTITAVANNAGLCQITVSTPPATPFTAGSFISVLGVGGATGCNDTTIDTSTTVQSVQSTTQITLGRVFSGGAYTSGGTAEKSSGWFIGGGGTFVDAHAEGNSYDTSVGNVLHIGGTLLSGVGPSIVSSAAIPELSNFTHTISGTAAIDTIVPPSGWEGEFCALPTGAWSTTTAGNFAAAFTATSGVRKCWNYSIAAGKWY